MALLKKNQLIKKSYNLLSEHFVNVIQLFKNLVTAAIYNSNVKYIIAMLK